MNPIYSEPSIKDMRRLREHIAEYNPQAANRIAQQLVNRLEKLTEFPYLGVPVVAAPNPQTIRDLILDDYIVRYSCHNETIVVLRIWHHLENLR